ncbi:11952_t:CDS:2 [Dentiscutata erythropus]|uniref:11952_t:CDS:1 n=1 Tax=Dentiscutata erythropus TaxID=1348616 RepID=A0A9N9APH3_9GLOM|nr:11952_t:CDS:2 [Dentiscutata erythropus]
MCKEVNLKYIYNHIINSAESLSFWRVDEEVHGKLIKLFNDGYSSSFALHTYKDTLHLSISNEQELEETLGDFNGEPIFKRLEIVVKNYNSLGCRKAVLQKYDARVETSFIFCIVMGLMCCVYKKISQASELYYMDVLAFFDPLNTSVTLLYTSCTAGALSLGLFIISDEFKLY